MGGIMDTITGKSARLAQAAQERQAADLATEKAKVDATEKGQQTVSNAGGGGLLAYVSDNAKLLRRSFGG